MVFIPCAFNDPWKYQSIFKKTEFLQFLNGWQLSKSIESVLNPFTFFWKWDLMLTTSFEKKSF